MGRYFAQTKKLARGSLTGLRNESFIWTNSDHTLKQTPLLFTNCGRFSVVSKSGSPKLAKTCAWHDVRSYRTHSQSPIFPCVFVDRTYTRGSREGIGSRSRPPNHEVFDVVACFVNNRFGVPTTVTYFIRFVLSSRLSERQLHRQYVALTHQPRLHSEGPS